MPALTKQTEDLRKVQALEAVKLMGMGVKKADACELFYEAYLPFPIFLFARIVCTIHGNGVPKMLYLENISKFLRRMKVDGGDFILRWYSGGIFFQNTSPVKKMRIILY